MAALAVPSVAGPFVGSGFDPGLENRREAPLPPLRLDALAAFPRDFERWFGDRFGFRATLIRWTSRAKVALGVSPSPKVVIGRDGFLFYGGERSIELYQRALALSPKELERWQTALERRRAALARRGIRYVVLFPPDKEGVYPRLLPDGIPRLSGPSELDQLLAGLDGHTSVAAVDLRPSLEQAETNGTVYFATDTHWNGRGIVAGYHPLMERVRGWFPDARILGDAEVALRSGPELGGDLAGMLGLREDLREQQGVRYDVRAPLARPAEVGFRPDPQTPPHAMPRAWSIDDPKLPRALVLGDSFMAQLVPLLAEGFSRTLFVGKHVLDASLVERENPDIVIEEWVERYILGGPPANGAWVDDPPGDPVPSPRHLDEEHPPGQPLPSTANWGGNDVSRVESGLLQATGDDPYLQTTIAPFDAEPSLTVWVPLRAIPARPEQRGGHFAQLFWSVEGAPFTEEASIRFPVLIDGTAHTYRVLPSLSRAFQGRITAVRIDFPDLLPGVRYALGELEISAPSSVTPELRTTTR